MIDDYWSCWIVAIWIDLNGDVDCWNWIPERRNNTFEWQRRRNDLTESYWEAFGLSVAAWKSALWKSF